MSTPPYHAVYRAPEVHTLSHALLVHSSVPHPLLKYRQTLFMKNPAYDLLFSEGIHYDATQHLLTIRFPSECHGFLRRIRNSRNCRMVTYWQHPETQFIQEVEFRGGEDEEWSLIHPRREPVLHVYTQGYDDLTISFDVYLFKPSFGRQIGAGKEIPSKLSKL